MSVAEGIVSHSAAASSDPGSYPKAHVLLLGVHGLPKTVKYVCGPLGEFKYTEAVSFSR
jgi:hypothetical protein